MSQVHYYVTPEGNTISTATETVTGGDRGYEWWDGQDFVPVKKVDAPANGAEPVSTNGHSRGDKPTVDLENDHNEEPIDIPAVKEAPWPEMGEAAYHGIAGEIVGTNEPHSEADPAGVLMCLLAGFGAMVGGRPYVPISSSRHHARLFVLLVGDTALGRKGMAWNDARQFLRAADPVWTEKCIANGLSSGEGLIHAVRDPDAGNEDPGGEDEMLVNETEFSRVLVAASREGNTLSDIIRIAWDGGTLRSMTRKNPLKASNPHIAMLGHITPDDAVERLSSVQVLNGFGNRFLYCCVRKSKDLPFGGVLDDAVVQELGARLQGLRDKARSRTHIGWASDEARGRWAEVYLQAARKERYGLLGAVTGRAQPQMLRLALTYALLDGSDAIDVPHLQAAFAVWDYCEQSAYRLFGSVSGDPIREKLFKGLVEAGEDGLTDTEQHELFGGHATQAELKKARAALLGDGVALREKVGGTGGRARNVMLLATHAKKAKERIKSGAYE